MVWCTKFSFVGRELRQALHMKFFILFGTYNDQIPRHKSLSSVNRAEFSVASSSDLKNRYPDLLVYVPVWVKGQKSLSSTPCCGSGMDLINFTSLGMKIPSMTIWFQRYVASSISLSTLHLPWNQWQEKLRWLGVSVATMYSAKCAQTSHFPPSTYIL